MNGATTWVVLGVAVLVLVWVTVLCVARSRRLDRLHQRTDAARVGLESALARRASVAVAVAEGLGAARAPEGSPVAALGHAARAAGAGLVRDLPREWDQGVEARELVENALSRALGAVDRDLLPTAVLAELVDAEQLVVLARRVHNDAVRDTRGLRSRRLVRWLRLYGTAPLPEYFEIAESAPHSGRVASTDGPVSRE
ncbi:NUDIX hydrolase [Pseudonocardia sp. WMMC193]|uniref:NUDIX hydrolase n=1 Tax=Pseudonocardia sp. WMMC193 TaxID=2911965 RepID=UPI001F3AAC7F|nr:NUDIX hydrolase [Pseudonocardia sp. WMMC193]MCF7549252.1 NUDIX hydrolase [Pseudonocardia sp. WMMC193]